MATTRYVVAATPSNEAKTISNLKSARTEADARARLDRVDVEVRTESTNKLSYTAKGAPTAPAEAPAQEAPAADETPAPAEAPAPVDQDAPAEDEDAAAAAILGVTVAVLNGDEDADSEGDEAPAAEGPDPQRKAACGCLVEAIIANGTHGKGCADAAAAKAQAAAVTKDPQPAKARAARTGRREALGPSVVEDWDLLYDKPRQKAQVGRNAAGKYSLICTDHKSAYTLARLTQERGLRGGKRSVWCEGCKTAEEAAAKTA